MFLEILGANPIIFFRPGSIPNASRSTGLRLLARRVKRIRLFARSPINLSKNTDSYPAFLSDVAGLYEILLERPDISREACRIGSRDKTYDLSSREKGSARALARGED